MALQPTVSATVTGLLYINGMQVSHIDDEKISIAAGACRNSNNRNDIILSEAVTVDVTKNGLNGLDTGTVGASKRYAIYAIGDSYGYLPSGGILSLNLTSPLLPSGDSGSKAYNMWQRVGYIDTDSSSDFLPAVWTGEGSIREVTYDTLINVVSAGTDNTFTDVDCSGAVPAGARMVYFEASITPNSAGDEIKLRRNGSASTNGSAQLSGSVASVAKTAQLKCPCDADGIVEYLVDTSATGSLWVSGYQDYL